MNNDLTKVPVLWAREDRSEDVWYPKMTALHATVFVEPDVIQPDTIFILFVQGIPMPIVVLPVC